MTFFQFTMFGVSAAAKEEAVNRFEQEKSDELKQQWLDYQSWCQANDPNLDKTPAERLAAWARETGVKTKAAFSNGQLALVLA